MVYTEEYHIRKRKGNTYLLMPDPVSRFLFFFANVQISTPIPVSHKAMVHTVIIWVALIAINKYQSRHIPSLVRIPNQFNLI